MADDWDGAVKDAKRPLVTTLRYPTSQTVLVNRMVAKKGEDQFRKDREQLRKSLLDLKEKYDTAAEVLEQFQDDIDEANLWAKREKQGRSGKNKGRKKTLHATLQTHLDDATDTNKQRRELDKHMADLMGYAGDCKSM
jgi:hypothetical protein